MNQLALFFQNIAMREAVKEFLVANLAEMAVDKTFAGESVSGIKDAKDCVDKSFTKLEEMYGKIKTVEIPNSR